MLNLFCYRRNITPLLWKAVTSRVAISFNSRQLIVNGSLHPAQAIRILEYLQLVRLKGGIHAAKIMSVIYSVSVGQYILYFGKVISRVRSSSDLI